MCVRSIICKKVFALLAAVLLCLILAGEALAAPEDVIGSIAQGLSVDDALWKECPLGDYLADAVRERTGAQAALIPSELLKNALVGDGSVTEEDVAELLREDCAVYVYTLTASQFKALLEDSVSHWQLTERETLDSELSAYGGFLQISGFTMTADASAPVGERVISVTMGGDALDLDSDAQTIKTALPAVLNPGVPGVRADGTVLSMVRDRIAANGAVETPEGDRIRVIGAHARDIIGVIPPWFIGLLVIVLLANALLTKSRRRETE